MATTVGLNEVAIESLVQNADKKATVALAANGHDSILEPKLDGWRVIFRVTDDEDTPVQSYTRTGNSLTGSMPAIEAELAANLPSGTVLDGEVVKLTQKNGKVIHGSSNDVAKVLGSGTAKAALRSGDLTLVVFDMIAHGGIDARPLPYAKRREVLEKLFDVQNFTTRVQLIPQLPAVEESYDDLIAAGYEGAMVKWLNAAYASGKRGAGWWKLKGTATVDVIVTGYKPGTPGSSFDGYVGAIEYGQYNDDGILVPRGRCSGMDWDVRVDITQHKADYLGRVFELTHNGVQKPEDGESARFRHPRFIRWRDDKPAAAVKIHDA